jgi:hypothetical protein
MKFLPLVILTTLALAFVACRDDTPPPSEPLAVREVLPAQLRNGSEALVMVVGSGFRDGASVSLSGRRLEQTTFVNQALLATVVPAGTAIGAYPVTVTLPDGSSARAPGRSQSSRAGWSAPSASPSPTPSPSPSPPRRHARTVSGPNAHARAAPDADAGAGADSAPTAAPTPPPTAAPTRTPAPRQAPTPSPIFFRRPCRPRRHRVRTPSR